MLKHYRETRTDEHDGSEVLQDNHRQVADKQLVPRIIRRNRQAILVDPHYFDFFQRKKQGRRCSCFQVESSPDFALGDERDAGPDERFERPRLGRVAREHAAQQALRRSAVGPPNQGAPASGALHGLGLGL